MVQRIAVLACAFLLVGARTGSAQMLQWEDRGFVNVNFGGQGGSKEVTASFAFPLYGEAATVEATQAHKGSAFFDLGGGARVWNNLALGLNFTKRSADTDGSFTATVPDPVSYVFRVVTGSVTDLQRRETWLAIPVTYVIPVTDKADVMVFGGPSHLSLTQELVTGATTSEGASGPVVTVTREAVDKGFWGYLLGVDFTYRFTRQLGAGGFLRVQSADGDLTPNVRADGGGFQAGGGLRVRF
jgi:hypothetical protein